MNDTNDYLEDAMKMHSIVEFKKSKGLPKKYKKTGLELLWGIHFKVRQHRSPLLRRIPIIQNEQ